jgi:hypothetical protein
MGVLTARVKHAERMMTQAAAINQGVEITFADGCKGLIPWGYPGGWKAFGFIQY